MSAASMTNSSRDISNNSCSSCTVRPVLLETTGCTALILSNNATTYGLSWMT